MSLKIKVLAGIGGVLLGALVVFSATKAGMMFLIVASLLLAFQFTLFILVMVMYGKMLDAIRKTSRTWRQMDKEIAGAISAAQELHIALDAVLRFGEQAPTNLADHQLPKRDIVYDRFDKEEAPQTEEWSLDNAKS